MLEKALQTALSAIIAVVALFILTRMMGKKQMAQLNFFDYVIGISIGSIAAEYAIDHSIEMVQGISALVVFTLVSILISFITVKTYTGRKILDGTPLLLMENGRIIEENLRKSKLNINDLLEECRQKNVFDISDIEYALLETSGRLSILLKTQKQPITPKDMGIETNYIGLCANVIIDGKIIKAHLAAIGLDERWLLNELKKTDVNTFSNILLAYVDSSGMLHVHFKNEILKQGNVLH